MIKMNKIITENIKKFNQAKEELAKRGIEIIDYDFKTKKNRLAKDGKFIGYLDIENDLLELR
jgi:tRNA isopentenyl-2-thiomethyl-A-37 hydroxylase MiaE